MRPACVASVAVLFASCIHAYGQSPPQDEAVVAQLKSRQYDLDTNGRTFLLSEAKRASFFLLGELHGENEIPALLRALWPEMWKDGYRHIAAEVSPWAAHHLETSPPGGGPAIQGLWTKAEARFVRSAGSAQAPVLWGCDMDEMQPHLLIQELAQANPANPILKRMAALTQQGYKRKMAPELLESARGLSGIQDRTINDVSLRESLLATLKIESDRLDPETRHRARNRREALMKEQFLIHYRKHVAAGSPAKVMFRFGRNHLHRGYDARGISTLGNFAAEFGLAQKRQVFNVAAFAAGGTAFLAGETFDADERQDDPAFALLASVASHPATVFDLRPLRQILHRIPNQQRTALQTSLVYWADSYDAMICYRQITPLPAADN